MPVSAHRIILLAGLSAIALAAPARAQDAAPTPPATTVPPASPTAVPAEEAADASPQDSIIVTGTRRSDRTVADSPVPVDVITADTLAQSGHTELTRALTQEVPSFNFPQPSITDGSDVIRPATLRGLSPDQTLVLINGKRRHTSALLNINGSVGRGSSAVDINLIPSIALSRVEVLRDGAAAQYGSDAIAGVINFQLRSAPSGGRATLTYGQFDTHVEGVETYDSVLTGAGNTPLLAPDGTLQLDYSGNDRKRTDGRTVTLAAVVGIPIIRDGYLNVAAEIQDREDTNRTGADPRRQYNLIAGALDPRELTFDRFSHRYGDPKVRDLKLFVNSAAPIGDSGAEVYWFGSYADRQGESAGFYRLPNDARNVPAIYPDGFLPLITTDTDDYSSVVGIRGELGGWRVDLSGQGAINKVDFRIENSLNRSFGAASQTEFDSGGLKYGQLLANLDVSRDLKFGFADRTTLSMGAEYRRETFDIRPGEVASYANGPAGGAPGAQVFPGFQPVIGGQRVDQRHSRNNKSLYAEVDSDISKRFNVQAALRYEDYSDFGQDLNWKLAGRFEPVDGFALRASASTGFRAPSLQQQFYAAQATNNVAGVLLDTVTLPVGNPVAQALGASPLDAERSFSLSGGLVFTRIPRLSITIDAYRVDIKDRILVTDNLQATRDALGNPCSVGAGCTATGGAIAAILNGAGFPTTTAARFFINGIDTRTSGVDAVATYRLSDLFGGRLNLTAGLNLNKTKITKNSSAPGALSSVPNLVLFGRQESTRLVRGQPRYKINLSGNFERSWLGLTLRATRYGKVIDAGASEFFDVNLKPKTIVDTELRVKPLGDRLTLALGANNLFDVYPTNTPRGQAINPATGLATNYAATRYVTPFSSFSPFGFNGRFLYVRAAVQF